jgi:hypothetical protein
VEIGIFLCDVKRPRRCGVVDKLGLFFDGDRESGESRKGQRRTCFRANCRRVGRKERESLGRKKDQKACRAFPGDDLRSRAATQLLH